MTRVEGIAISRGQQTSREKVNESRVGIGIYPGSTYLTPWNSRHVSHHGALFGSLFLDAQAPIPSKLIICVHLVKNSRDINKIYLSHPDARNVRIGYFFAQEGGVLSRLLRSLDDRRQARPRKMAKPQIGGAKHDVQRVACTQHDTGARDRYPPVASNRRFAIRMNDFESRTVLQITLSTPSARDYLRSGQRSMFMKNRATIVESAIGSIYMSARMQTTSSCTINCRIAQKLSSAILSFRYWTFNIGRQRFRLI